MPAEATRCRWAWYTVLLGDASNTIVWTEFAANAKSLRVGSGTHHTALGLVTVHVTLGNGVGTVTTMAGTDTLTFATGQYTLSNADAIENVVLGRSELINWFTTRAKLNQLTSSDGHVITAAGTGRLAQAMAPFGAPAAGGLPALPEANDAGAVTGAQLALTP